MALTMESVAVPDDPDSLAVPVLVVPECWKSTVLYCFLEYLINICIVLTLVTLTQGQLSLILRNSGNFNV